jgi:MSHA biogenesis protein MshJ
MNFLKNSISGFNKLPQRERLLVATVIPLLVFFIGYVLLLVPQQKNIKNARLLIQTQQAELASINAKIAMKENEAAMSLDLQEKNRSAQDEFQKKIDEVNVFLGQTDPSTSQVGALIKGFISANAGLTLMSLKTLPVVMFYTPAQKSSTSGTAVPNQTLPNQTLEAQKNIYKHGIEVSVKGKYMALLSYMEHMQNYPKRLFWSEAKLDVSAYPEAVLSLVIYSLNEQPSSPLR